MNKTYLTMQIKTTGYMVAQKNYMIENIAQYDTCKHNIPKLRTLQEPNPRKLQKKRENIVMKRDCEKWLLPKHS
jgi:hypothetical protein